MPSKATGISKEKNSVDKDINIAIYDHAAVRMSILVGARQSIRVLQREEKLYQLRKEKLEAYQEMKEIFGEIMSMNLKLEKLMPKIKRAVPAIEKKGIEAEVEERIIERPILNSRIDELEDELADIEKRMSSLK